jgi:hypothetical protein
MSRKVRGFLTVLLVLGLLGSSFAFAGYKVKGPKTAPTPNLMRIKGT